jgi:hypothetical protein
MLCASIMRWKFQRSRIGKLPNSVWYFSAACTITSSGLSASKVASNSSLPRSCAHSCVGSTWLSQSTTWPITANSKASNAPMMAVRMVMPSTKRRTPVEQAQMNGKTPLGGGSGSPSG